MATLKIPKLWPAVQLGRATAAASGLEVSAARPADGLDAFGSETAPKVEIPPTLVEPAKPGVVAAWPGVQAAVVGKWLVVILLSAGVAVAGVIGYQRRFPRTPPTGNVTIETTPAGLDVVMAGKSLGKTPLTTTFAPGAYEVQVGAAPDVRTLKVNVTAGMSVVQHVEFAGSPGAAGAAATGGLRVQTEPAHLQVLVDGIAKGVSPVVIDQLVPGEHEVSVRTSSGVIRRTVNVQPRETLSLIVSSTAAPVDPGVVPAGWITVTSPIPLQLREDGDLIGTTESDRLMLPAGDHDLELSNAALGFTAKRTGPCERGQDHRDACGSAKRDTEPERAALGRGLGRWRARWRNAHR